MNRRELLRRLVGGAAVATVLPLAVHAATEPVETQEWDCYIVDGFSGMSLHYLGRRKLVVNEELGTVIDGDGLQLSAKRYAERLSDV